MSHHIAIQSLRSDPEVPLPGRAKSESGAAERGLARGSAALRWAGAGQAPAGGDGLKASLKPKVSPDTFPRGSPVQSFEEGGRHWF